jgi:hypothetical protein
MTWRETYRRNGYFFHIAGLVTIASGFFLHLSRVFFGDQLLLEHLLNPTSDQVLLVPMTYAAITGIMVWNRVEFVNTPQKVLFRIVVIYTAASVPLHGYVSVIYGDVRPYVDFFPMWFSYLLFVPYTAFLVLFSTLRYKKD